MKKVSLVLVSTLLSFNCWSADGDAAVARVYRTECVPDAQHNHQDEDVRQRDGSTAVQIEIKGAVILESRLSFADNSCQKLLGKSVRNGTLSVDANDSNVSYVTRNGYYIIRSNGNSERTIELPYHRLISDLSQLPAEIQQATQGLVNPRVYMVTGFMAMAFRSGQNRQSEENKLTISPDGQQLKVLGAVLTLQK